MFISQFYQQLADLLFGADFRLFLASESLPKIAHLDLYEKQPLREATEIAYNLPAVFLEAKLLRTEPIPRGLEEEYNIRLHIEAANIGSTAHNSHNQNASLSHLRLTEALKLYIAKFLPAYEIAGLSLDQRGRRNPVHILELNINVQQKIC